MSDNHLSAKIGQYAIIKNDAEKVLILERMRSKTWCLPGGRLNENEEWDTALLRELKEELNLECQNPSPIAVNIIKDDYQTKYCVYFKVDCTNLPELKISDEHSNLGWFSLGEIQKLDIEDEQIKKVIIDYLS
ncbi:MAG: NUDIX hydrolase [Candidatus Saccharibacteria bacterium]